MSVKRFFVAILSITYAMCLQAQVNVQQKLDRTDILIGEQVKLHLSVTAAQGTRIEFPQPADTIVSGVELLDISSADTVSKGNNKVTIARDYLLTSFDSALYEIPALEVTVNDRKYRAANPIGLKVSTVPVDTIDMEKSSGPHGPVGVTFQWDRMLTAQSLLLWVLLIVITALLLRIKSHKPITRKITIYPPKPSHEVAIERISKIKQSVSPNDQAALRRCFDQITEVLKLYIQERFGFETAQLTSGEIIQRLSHLDSPEAMRELREVLSAADLVKFADMETTQTEAFRNMNEIVSFVSHTRLSDQELPVPEVREVVVGDKKGKMIRRLAIALTGLLIVAELILLCTLCYVVYDCFA